MRLKLLLLIDWHALGKRVFDGETIKSGIALSELEETAWRGVRFQGRRIIGFSGGGSLYISLVKITSATRRSRSLLNLLGSAALVVMTAKGKGAIIQEGEIKEQVALPD